ncbi:adrenodoxin 1, mitochondrial [Fagus crenata]
MTRRMRQGLKRPRSLHGRPDQYQLKQLMMKHLLVILFTHCKWGYPTFFKQQLLCVSLPYYYISYAHSFCTKAANKAHEEWNEEKEKICVTFIEKDGEEMHMKVPIGMSMLEATLENDIDIEGACEGLCACSTCHVIVQDMEYYNKLEDPTDEENEMLDLAFGLSEKYVPLP